ncbi:hypothetical protein [Sinorhizobium meliloti]|uniref:hypothetical protein n=1 Tax=Rhizobium meliloti TaxID=382 RepID=UPI0018658E4C|nr:hypothetical protein [Sinorhizobium meliloti]
MGRRAELAGKSVHTPADLSSSSLAGLPLVDMRGKRPVRSDRCILVLAAVRDVESDALGASQLDAEFLVRVDRRPDPRALDDDGVIVFERLAEMDVAIFVLVLFPLGLDDLQDGRGTGFRCS